jgi:hypothetical protein
LSRVKTKNGNSVASYGEATIDNWFWKNNWKCVYEPQIVIDDEEFLPDWILWPQKGISKPVIIEFWGLCRTEGNVAQWVINKREKYIYRKETKEAAYNKSEDYYYIGIYPKDIKHLSKILEDSLKNLINTNSKTV